MKVLLFLVVSAVVVVGLIALRSAIAASTFRGPKGPGK